MRIQAVAVVRPVTVLPDRMRDSATRRFSGQLQTAAIAAKRGLCDSNASVMATARTVAAVGNPGVKMNLETRAHLAECVSWIDDALKANMQRAGF